MEGGSFQAQMLSIMEVLAQAAVAEINRRVEDSCAVLRLEVGQSRRDIDGLKRKCEVLGAELRRTTWTRGPLLGLPVKDWFHVGGSTGSIEIHLSTKTQNNYRHRKF